MSENHGNGNEHAHLHHHACADLFGCGDEKGTGIIREDIKDTAFDNRASDTLLHMDEVDQETLEGRDDLRLCGSGSLSAGNKNHERNGLVYCVSCAMEAKSTMTAANPRSSIVAFLACALAASTASSSSAMASCPSV